MLVPPSSPPPPPPLACQDIACASRVVTHDHTVDVSPGVFPTLLPFSMCQTTREFTIQGSRRSRNEEKMARKSLPLPSLRSRGFKGYMVNLIQVRLQAQR